MNLNRRTVLVGLGSIAAGGGALAGTGAFSSVEANRDVTVSVEGDANAYLALLPYDGPNGDGSQYVQTANGELAVTLDKVNKDAVTTLENVFEVLNQGSQPVALYVEDGSDEVSFTAEGASIEGESNAVNLGVGKSTAVSIEVDTTDGQAVGDVLLEEVTVVAEADDAPVARARNTLYVNDDGTGDFDNIQEAVSNASSGTTIQVASGTYSGFNIPSSAASGLSVVGAGGSTNTTLVQGRANIEKSNTSLSGVRFESTEESGIDVSNASGVTVQNCVIDGTNQTTGSQGKQFGIRVSSAEQDGVVSNLKIVGNRIIGVRNERLPGSFGDALDVDDGSAYGISLDTESNATFENTQIVRNVVKDLRSAKAFVYAVQLNQGPFNGVSVLGNYVRNAVGNNAGGSTSSPPYTYAEGVGVECDGTDIDVRQNDIENVFVRDGTGGVGVVVSGLSNVGEVVVSHNSFSGCDAALQSKVSAANGTLDARENWYDSESGPTVTGAKGSTEPNTFNVDSQGQAIDLVNSDTGTPAPAVEYTPWLDAPADEGGDAFAPVAVNNPGEGTQYVASLEPAIGSKNGSAGLLAADGTVRVNGSTGDEFDVGTTELRLTATGATVESTATGRPTILNAESSKPLDFGLRIQAQDATVSGLRVFSEAATNKPKEFRLEADGTTLLDCEVDRGHAVGAGATGQSGIQILGTRTGVSVRNCDLSQAAIGLSGGSGHDVEAIGNRVRDSHSEGIFASLAADVGSYTVRDNDVKDYAQANSKAAFLFTELPASLNGSGSATAEGYVDEILASNPEIPEAKVTDGDGTDSRKTQ